MLKTEMRNEHSRHIDKMDTLSMLRVINQENYNAVNAVEAALDKIAEVCDMVAECFENSGRLFYIGAGTSGRIGVMDAAECPPTFGVSPEQMCDEKTTVVALLHDVVEDTEYTLDDLAEFMIYTALP